MKGSELARNQVHEELDPFKMINKTPELSKEEEELQKEVSKEDLKRESEAIKKSGFEESMVRMNLQLSKEDQYIDRSVAPSAARKINSTATNGATKGTDASNKLNGENTGDEKTLTSEEAQNTTKIDEDDDEEEKIGIEDQFEVIKSKADTKLDFK